MPDGNRELLIQLVENQTTVDGRFTDIHRIGINAGSGFFSLMFSALDTSTGGRAALKVFHPEQNDPYRRASFEREETLLRSLSGQPDIIQWIAPRSRFQEHLPTGLSATYAIDFDYYALELAVSDLRSVVATEAWGAVDLIRAFREACRGVQRLHANSIAHRDLKPENLLVMQDGTLRVSDLGAARRLDDGVTPALRSRYDYQPGDGWYAAPELLACVHDSVAKIAYKADIYGLGAILFEILTGQVLGAHLLVDLDYVSGLAGICFVDRAKRLDIYHDLLPEIADRPMPSVGDFDSVAPPLVRGPLESLYRELTNLDYRKRLVDFTRIFRRIDSVLLMLRNQDAYKRWKQQRDARRASAMAKENGRRRRRSEGKED